MRRKEESNATALKVLRAMCDAVEWSPNVVVDPVYAAPQYGIFLPRDQLQRQVDWLQEKGYFDDELTSRHGVAISQTGLDAAKAASGPALSAKTVLVIGGRNLAARERMEAFLRTVGLEPLEGDRQGKGRGVEAVRDDVEHAQAIVVVMTPDSPSVMMEAGIALGLASERTIFAALGSRAPVPAEIAGSAILWVNDRAESRQALRARLAEAGCELAPADAATGQPVTFDDCVPEPASPG